MVDRVPFGQLLRTLGEGFLAAERGETDPVKLADAFSGGAYSDYLGTTRDDGTWWELFGLDARPASSAELDAAWRSWAARNHPDQGNPEPAFRFMRNLYEQQKAKLL